jgi:hypothetical protein
LKPGNLAINVYWDAVVSTAIQLFSGGGAWFKNDSYGARGLSLLSFSAGEKMVGGAGGGYARDEVVVVSRVGEWHDVSAIRRASGVEIGDDADAYARAGWRSEEESISVDVEVACWFASIVDFEVTSLGKVEYGVWFGGGKLAEEARLDSKGGPAEYPTGKEFGRENGNTRCDPGDAFDKSWTLWSDGWFCESGRSWVGTGRPWLLPLPRADAAWFDIIEYCKGSRSNDGEDISLDVVLGRLMLESLDSSTA